MREVTSHYSPKEQHRGSGTDGGDEASGVTFYPLRVAYGNRHHNRGAGFYRLIGVLGLLQPGSAL